MSDDNEVRAASTPPKAPLSEGSLEKQLIRYLASVGGKVEGAPAVFSLLGHLTGRPPLLEHGATRRNLEPIVMHLVGIGWLVPADFIGKWVIQLRPGVMSYIDAPESAFVALAAPADQQLPAPLPPAPSDPQTTTANQPAALAPARNLLPRLYPAAVGSRRRRNPGKAYQVDNPLIATVLSWVVQNCGEDGSVTPSSLSQVARSLRIRKAHLEYLLAWLDHQGCIVWIDMGRPEHLIRLLPAGCRKLIILLESEEQPKTRTRSDPKPRKESQIALLQILVSRPGLWFLYNGHTLGLRLGFSDVSSRSQVSRLLLELSSLGYIEIGGVHAAHLVRILPPGIAWLGEQSPSSVANMPKYASDPGTKPIRVL